MEGQAGITRFICGVFTAMVSACLLTCAFVNVAFADWTELPAASDNEGTSNYSPKGTLFGYESNIFTTPWTSDESLFTKSWSSISSIIKPDEMLLTINADLSRMTNNYLSRINGYLNDKLPYIEQALVNIRNEAGDIRNALYNDTTITGTYTIRHYLVSAAAHAGNIDSNLSSLSSYIRKLESIDTNLDSVESYLHNSSNVSYLSLINTNTGKLNSIDTRLQNANTYLSTISASVNPAISDIYNKMSNTYDDVHAMSQNFNATISSVNDSLLNVTTSLGSGGYIGQQLATLNTNISAIETDLNSILTAFRSFSTLQNSTVSYLTMDDGNRNYFIKSVPFAFDDGASIGLWTRNVRDLLSNIANKTQTDYTQTLTSIVDALGSGGYIGQQLTQLNTTLSALSTAFTKYSNVYNSTISNMPNQTGGAPIYYVKALPIAYDDGAAIPTWTRDVRNYLRTISQKTSTDYSQVLNSIDDNTNIIGSHLETIIELIRNLDLTVNVNIPDNSQELIGDFDTDAFKTNSDLLIERVSKLAPFGAITVASAELGILTQVDPIQKPSMTIPFNFSTKKENVVLDLSWLDDAKPLFNFVMEFLFILMLLNVTMKYVRQEATS